MDTRTNESRSYLDRVTNGMKSTLLLVLLFGTLAARVWKKDSD